jgi:hypothetical protein
MVSEFIIKSNPFQINLYGITQYPILFFCKCMYAQFSQKWLLKILSFPHCVVLILLFRISCLYMCGFISGVSILLHWSGLSHFFYLYVFISVSYCFEYYRFVI